MRDEPLTADEIEERVGMLLDAQEKLREAIEQIESAVSDLPGYGSTDAYLLAPLRIRVSREHGYLTRDPNIDELIEQVRCADIDEEALNQEYGDLEEESAVITRAMEGEIERDSEEYFAMNRRQKEIDTRLSEIDREIAKLDR